MLKPCRAKALSKKIHTPRLGFLFLLVVGAGHAQSKLSLDSTGWTVFRPHAETQILYVSSSAGDDSLGQAYAPGAAAVGSDPFHPTPSIQPFKSVSAAVKASRSGKPDWILFKKGDTWINETLPMRNGLAADAPFLYSAYGDGERPFFKTGPQGAYRQCCKNFNNLAIAHLDFYAHSRNPDSDEFVSMDGTSGFDFYVGETYAGKDVLIEGCRFRFYTNNIVQGPGTMENIRLRRNTFLDNYSATAHSQGLYSANQSLTLEENFFDHNGWYRQAETGLGQSDGIATMFNHNTYFADSHDVIFRGNVFLRASSIGNKWTANYGEGSAQNLTIDDNLYLDGEIGISMGGNESKPPYRFKNISITRNVMLDIGYSQPTHRTLGWYLEINDWDGGEVASNVFLNVTNPKVTNVYGLHIEGETRDVAIHNNVIYGLNTPSKVLELTDGSVKTHITLARNTFDNRNAKGKLLTLTGSLQNYAFADNRYYATLDAASWFDLGGKKTGFSEWPTASGETGARSGQVAFPDPNRDAFKCMASLQRDTSRSAFIQAMRNQSRDHWDPALTAARVNAWIRAGFQTADDTVHSALLHRRMSTPHNRTGFSHLYSADGRQRQMRDAQGWGQESSPHLFLWRKGGVRTE